LKEKFLEGSNWVAKDNYFLWDKEKWPSSFQIMVVFLNKNFNSEK